MLAKLVSILPPALINRIGHLQFSLPVVGPYIGKFGRRFIAGQGRIKHGIGRGLFIDATGVNPGFLMGTTDPLEQGALEKFLHPGDVFFDIGANAGFFCVLAARIVGPAGKVHAFDPHPKWAARIRKNAMLNGFTNIIVHEIAIADSIGRTSLQLDDVPCPSIEFGNKGSGISVEITTIDNLIFSQGVSPPNYVVIDAEGAEIRVLKGMHKTIEQYRPTILVEVHWIGDRFLQYVKEEIEPLGYHVANLSGMPFPTEVARYHALLTPAN